MVISLTDKLKKKVVDFYNYIIKYFVNDKCFEGVYILEDFYIKICYKGKSYIFYIDIYSIRFNWVGDEDFLRQMQCCCNEFLNQYRIFTKEEEEYIEKLSK